MNTNIKSPQASSAGSEAKAFLLISAIIIPLLTMLGIFGYGFATWVMQIFNGPPTHL